MWKDLYCFALRIDMVLPDWRGFIGLGPHPLLVASVPIDLKLAAQPHILKGTCTKPHHPIAISSAGSIWIDLLDLVVLSITFAWLLCARRESP